MFLSSLIRLPILYQSHTQKEFISLIYDFRFRAWIPGHTISGSNLMHDKKHIVYRWQVHSFIILPL